MAKTKTIVTEFEVGDTVTEKGHSKTHTGKGKIIFIHPKDEVKYIVDFGNEWQGYMVDELRIASTPSKSERNKLNE